MRHATEEDLDRLKTLLLELRKLPQLRERKPGYFSLGGRALVHFHENAGELYADLRLKEDFERLPVTSPNEQALLLSRVISVVQDGTHQR